MCVFVRIDGLCCSYHMACAVLLSPCAPEPFGAAGSSCFAAPLAGMSVASATTKAAPAESCDGKPLAPLAKRIPRPKTTGNRDLDTKRSFEYSCMTRIVDRMSKDPEVISHLHNFMLNTNMKSLETAREKGNAEWTGEYKSLERVPRSWMSEFLVRRARDTGCDQIFNQDTLKRLCDENQQQVDMLFYFETQTVGSMPFPKGLEDPYTAATVFSRRAAQVGERLKDLTRAGGLAQGNRVDFRKGCYELEFEGAWLKSVRHVSSNVKVQSFDEHIRISTRFELVDNHLDHAARVTLNPTSYTLCDLFPADCAFKRTMYAKKTKAITDLITIVAQELRQEHDAKARAIIAPDTRIQDDLQKKQSAENLAKAREKLERTKHANKRLRTMNFEVATAAPPIADSSEPVA